MGAFMGLDDVLEGLNHIEFLSDCSRHAVTDMHFHRNDMMSV